MTEDEMAGWHHRLNGNELGQTPGPLEPEIICSLTVLKVIKEHCMFLN